MSTIAMFRQWFLSISALLMLFNASNVGAEEYQYRLGPGDSVKIDLGEEDGMERVYRIDDSGIVPYPYTNGVAAIGLTIDELAAEIDRRLRDGYYVNPRVEVGIVSYRPFFITGEVNRQGNFPYEASLTVNRAIAIAGGLTPRGDQDDIEITRGGKTFDADQRTIVHPGDEILVKERFF